MEKKFYEKPVMQVERFTPNEFVAACPRPKEWVAQCDTHSSLIFFGDEKGPYDLTCDMNRGGCGKTHTFTLEDGLKPKANCWILDGVTGDTRYSSSNLSTYSYMFENYPQSDVTNLTLKEEYAKSPLFKAAYWHELDGGGVLLTSDIGNIKNPS